MSYASLLLSDNKSAVTAANIEKIVKAANLKVMLLFDSYFRLTMLSWPPSSRPWAPRKSLDSTSAVVPEPPPRETHPLKPRRPPLSKRRSRKKKIWIWEDYSIDIFELP